MKSIKVRMFVQNPSLLSPKIYSINYLFFPVVPGIRRAKCSVIQALGGRG